MGHVLRVRLLGAGVLVVIAMALVAVSALAQAEAPDNGDAGNEERTHGTGPGGRLRQPMRRP